MVLMKLAEKFGYQWTAPKKGDLFLMDLEGPHYVIVVSDTGHNEENLNVYVIPLTTKQHPAFRGPRLTQADGVTRPCYAKIDEMRAVEKKNLGEYQGVVPPKTLSMLDEYLRTILFGRPRRTLPRRKK
jgi:mRNA-degrading endonuclease toxin of MazEF toxin-antitoxin module